MRNKLHFLILILGVIGIFVLSYRIPEERFRWEDERQIENLAESDEKEVSFQKINELSLADKFDIIYPKVSGFSEPIDMYISVDEKEELDEKGKSVLNELMQCGILVRDDNYVMDTVQKELYMEVTDSVNIVILYSFYFSDSEDNAVWINMDSDTGKVMGFMEIRQDADMDIERKAKKYVDYLGGNYLGLDNFYADDSEFKRLAFQIEGQLIYYFIMQYPYKPIYYKFGIVPVVMGYYDADYSKSGD